MQSVGDILKDKQFRKFTKPIYKDVLKQKFLRYSLFLYELSISDKKITKRQTLILMIITRFSIGCRKATAYLNHSDFQKLGFYPSDITKELKKLVDKKYIGWDRSKEEMWINRNLLSKSPIKEPKYDREILSKNLVHHSAKGKCITNNNQSSSTDTTVKTRPYRYT